mmetsp:Transcript_52236/g.122244  ORF Transcript_52236/g.122244 Transcript_52236/m.122244 type:complete len:310 (+) Transcript_52236:38-967(+)
MSSTNGDALCEQLCHKRLVNGGAAHEVTPKFVELLPPEYSRSVELCQFRAAIVPKALGNQLLKLLQALSPLGPDLLHLKRARAAADPASLEVLLCPQCSDLHPDIEEFLRSHQCPPTHTVEVPKHAALTRLQLASFSMHWPLTYRRPSLEPLEISDTKQEVYDRLLQRAREIGGDRCGCVIVDRSGKEVAIARDCSDEHPLRHAVMVAIERVSLSRHSTQTSVQAGTKRPHPDDDYLCCECEVVTTHEPCVMCAMALVHSRVRLVAFQVSDPGFGGLGGRIALHTCQSLNHQIRVLQCADKAAGQAAEL